MNCTPEITLFTALLYEDGAIDEAASLLKAEDFAQDDHRMAFRAMLELSQAGLPTDVAHLVDKLREHGYGDVRACELVDRLMDGQPRVRAVRHYAALVRKQALKRRLVGMSEAALASFESGADPAEVQRQLQEYLWEMQADHADSGPVAARDFVPDFLSQALHERETTGDLAGISTGIAMLDDLTTGIRPDEFWVAGALPGRGKTAFATQIAVGAAKRGLPVLFFSLEMTAQALVRRVLGNQFGVWSLRTLRDVSENTWKQIVRQAEEMQGLPLYIDQSPGLTASELSARARAAVRERDIKLIVVDYLQLLRGPEREIRERVGNAANLLRILAKETHVPVVALSQLRRPPDLNDRPSMLHLKESGDIECHANTVLLLYLPLNEKAQPSGEDEIIIGKQRNGPLGTVPVFFDTKTLIFKPRAYDAGGGQ
jgi:replicative DNA helicase